MEKTSKELLKGFVNSRHFTNTTDIMNGMKVIDVRPEEDLSGNQRRQSVKCAVGIQEKWQKTY